MLHTAFGRLCELLCAVRQLSSTKWSQSSTVMNSYKFTLIFGCRTCHLLLLVMLWMASFLCVCMYC